MGQKNSVHFAAAVKKKSPSQAVFSWPLAVDLPVGPGSEPVGFLEKLGCRVFQGRHSFYLSRRSDIEKICPDLLDFYSYPFGLKIVKSGEISPDGSPYYTSRFLAPASTNMSMRAVGSMLEKVTISNLLHDYEVAPQVFDLVCLQSPRATYHAFIVQHVGGDFVTGEEGTKFIRRFLRVFKKLGMEVVSINEHCDLRPPDFRHNIVTDSIGTYYVDIQNFVIYASGYRRRLENRLHDLLPPRPSKSSYMGKTVVQTPEFFLGAHGVLVDKARVLDLSRDNGTFAGYLLAAGVGKVVLVRSESVSSLIRQSLYLQEFSRFDVVSPVGVPRGDWDFIICELEDVGQVTARYGSHGTSVLVFDYGTGEKSDIQEWKKSEDLELLGTANLIVDSNVYQVLLVKRSLQ